MNEQKIGQSVMTSTAHGLQVGDRVTLSGYSNRHRHWIIRATANTADLAERVRPSRGYARHVRRRKQRERKP